MAFGLAIGATLGFATSNITKDFIEVKGKGPSCPVGQVSDECHLSSDGPACTFKIGSTTYKAIAKDSKDCEIGLVLHQPY